MGGGKSDEGESQILGKLRISVLLQQQSLHKTAKTFFRNTLQGLKSLLINGVSDLKPTIKSLSLKNPFSCTNLLNPPHSDHHQICFSNPTSDQLKPDHQPKRYYDYPVSTTHERKTLLEVEDSTTAPNINTSRHQLSLPLSKAGSYHEGRRRQHEDPVSKAANNYFLAQKMRELEMLDMAGDMDHTLDVVEALHCYSCLTSPVYLDLVDNFFMDMYADFSVPADELELTSIVTSSRSLSQRLDANRGLINSSSKRFGSNRRVHDSSSQRFNSSRRLGPIKAM